jgi:hypothetical protein
MFLVNYTNLKENKFLVTTEKKEKRPYGNSRRIHVQTQASLRSSDLKDYMAQLDFLFFYFYIVKKIVF